MFMCSAVTKHQQKLLSLLPIIPTILSVLGSFTILRLVATKCLGQNKMTSYERILVCLSICDIVMSATLVAMNFFSPKGTMVWSIGNAGSCTALAAFYQWSVFGAALYNASLSVYYLLTIRYGVSSHKMTYCVEPVLHGVSILFPLLTALWGLGVRAYDFIPNLALCWVSCSDGSCNAGTLRYIFAAPIAVAWGTIGISMCGIWHHVWTTIRRHEDHSSVRIIREQQMPTTDTSSRRDIRYNEQRKLQMVATQALLYVASFSMVTVWPIVLSVIEHHESTQSILKDPAKAPWLFAMMACCAVFFPMSGLFNCIIYIRPRYLSERSQNRMTESRWGTLCRVLSSYHAQTATGSRLSSRTMPEAAPASKISVGP